MPIYDLDACYKMRNNRPLALTSKRPSWGTTSKFRRSTERTNRWKFYGL